MKTKKLKTPRTKFLAIPEIKKSQKISKISNFHFSGNSKEK